jgi:hypothetical protein
MRTTTTNADKAGAGIVTAVFLAGWIGLMTFMMLGSPAVGLLVLLPPVVEVTGAVLLKLIKFAMKTFVKFDQF